MDKPTVEELMAMELHESIQISDYRWILRVPGGWLYTCFVFTDYAKALPGGVAQTFVPEPKQEVQQ